MDRNEEYHYGPKGFFILRAGDIFHVSGGPYYITKTGKRVTMAERGDFIMTAHLKDGDKEWIEATSVGGGSRAMIYVGVRCESNLDARLINEPHRVRKYKIDHAAKLRAKSQAELGRHIATRRAMKAARKRRG